jgi:hypothetical protein
MSLLTKAAILAAADLKHEDVAVPEWNGSVRVRTMTGTQREVFGASLSGDDGKADMGTFRVKLVVACVVGEDGAALFDFDDVKALSQKSGAALERVFAVASKLNGMAADSVEKAQGN